MECLKCKKSLAKKGSHFTCQGQCKGTFHRSCVKGLAADIKSGKNRIYCHNCEDEESEEEIMEEEQSQSNILKDIQKKLAAIPGLAKQLESISQSLSLLSDKYDTLIVEHEQSKMKINKLERTVGNINNKCVYLEKCNAALEQKLQDYEQEKRKNNIEIVGIEQLPTENVKDIVMKLGSSLNVDVTGIEWAKRSRQTKLGNRPAPIIVSFKANGVGSRDSWLAQRRKVAEIRSNMVTNGSADFKVYINEDLARATRALLWNTKKQLHGIYKYIWVSSGKILVRRTDGEKPIWIRAESDIADLCNQK